MPGGVHRIDTLPRRGYRFMGPVEKEENGGTVALPIVARAPLLPDKPSIAVLPFKNMEQRLRQDYFADGMVDEIIASLSRMRWSFVIASNSSLTYKNRAVDEKQLAVNWACGMCSKAACVRPRTGANHRAAHRRDDRSAYSGGSLRRRT